MNRVLPILLSLLVAGLAPADTVVLLDGTRSEAAVVSIGPSELTVRTDPKAAPKAIALKDVAEIQRDLPTESAQAAEPQVIVTSAGDRIRAGTWTLADGKVAFEGRSVGQRTVPLESLKMLLKPGEQSVERFVAACREKGFEAGEKDVLVVEDKQGTWRSASGVLRAADAEKITFRFDDRDRTTDRSAVRAVFLAPMGGKVEAPKGFVQLLDGSRLGFTDVAGDEKHVELTSPALGAMSLPMSAVERVVWTSDRVSPLSAMTPAKVEQRGFFGRPYPYRTDASVAGGRLLLDGRAYPTGLGTHSFCSLTYDLDGKYTQLVMTVGIDDAVRPAGDATLRVLGDGAERIKPVRITGRTPAQVIRADVKGVKTLTIEIGYGSDGVDVADHVDLAGARLIK